MIRRPPRSTRKESSAASDVYKRQTLYMIVGLILLPGARILTDRILLPGRNLADELVSQVKPNQGAAFLEASSYIGTSFLITWCI